MKTKMQHKRVASGVDAGKLRVTLEMTFSVLDECYLARVSDSLEDCEVNLRRGVRSRGVGPVGNAVSNRVLDVLAETIEKGRQKAVLSKPLRVGPPKKDE